MGINDWNRVGVEKDDPWRYRRERRGRGKAKGIVVDSGRSSIRKSAHGSRSLNGRKGMTVSSMDRDRVEVDKKRLRIWAIISRYPTSKIDQGVDRCLAREKER